MAPYRSRSWSLDNLWRSALRLRRRRRSISLPGPLSLSLPLLSGRWTPAWVQLTLIRVDESSQDFRALSYPVSPGPQAPMRPAATGGDSPCFSSMCRCGPVRGVEACQACSEGVPGRGSIYIGPEPLPGSFHFIYTFRGDWYAPAPSTDTAPAVDLTQLLSTSPDAAVLERGCCKFTHGGLCVGYCEGAVLPPPGKSFESDIACLTLNLLTPVTVEPSSPFKRTTEQTPAAVEALVASPDADNKAP